jgi:Flp pilus assembly protein TadG
MPIMLARRRCRFPRKGDQRAVAAVEFAMTLPVLMIFLGVASDYGMAEWSSSCLTNAVAQGAYYAFVTGTKVTQANVQTLVQNASSLNGVTATASSPALCYCPSGTPATLGAAVSCTTTCSDGSAPGNYMTITATYTLNGFFSMGALTIKGHVLSDTATVRLQ